MEVILEKVGAIFPAFGAEYFGNERELLDLYSESIEEYLKKANTVYKIDMDDFQTRIKGDFSDELQSQIICYAYSCAIGNILKKNDFQADFISFYSMGIYAALHYAGSLDYIDGIRIIKFCYDLVRENSSTDSFCMGIVVGLMENEIYKIIEKYSFQNIEIINRNSKHNMVLSGKEREVTGFLESCLQEGALYAKTINIKTPFHTKFVGDVQNEILSFINTELTIKDPIYPIISGYDQRIVNSIAEIKKEIVFNVRHSLNWEKTFESMLDVGIKCFVECGPGNSLNRIVKFIPGNFEIYNIRNLGNLLKTSGFMLNSLLKNTKKRSC